MAGQFLVAVDGLDALQDLENLPREIERAAFQAINKVTDRTYAASGRAIRKQVAFPARYLTGTSGRLQVTQRAQSGSLEAEITGRHRPTSLARFARSGSPASTRRRGGTMVEVSPGSPKFMERAFLLRLRAGAAGIDTKSNLGLAIRLRPGETLRNKRLATRRWNGLYLLYGPSVDQVFDDVAEDQAPEIAAHLENEFFRLMRL